MEEGIPFPLLTHGPQGLSTCDHSIAAEGAAAEDDGGAGQHPEPVCPLPAPHLA
jgi:hypothetical protein